MWKTIARWAERVRPIETIVGLVVLVSGYFAYLHDPQSVAFALDVTQLVVILGLSLHAYLQFRISETPHARGNRHSRATEQFFTHWCRLWLFAWLPLYFGFSLHGLLLWFQPAELPWIPRAVNLFANGVNNLQAVFTFLLFLTMTKPTVGKRGVPNALCLTAVGILSVSEVFVVSVVPNLSSLTPEAAKHIQNYGGLTFGLLSGILCAVSLSMFTGRLESILLKVPPIRLALLYVYCAIQPLFPLLRTDLVQSLADRTTVVPWVQVFLKAAAGLLKVFLYLVVSELLSTGRLRFFFEEASASFGSIDERWEKFNRATEREFSPSHVNVPRVAGKPRRH